MWTIWLAVVDVLCYVENADYPGDGSAELTEPILHVVVERFAELIIDIYLVFLECLPSIIFEVEYVGLVSELIHLRGKFEVEEFGDVLVVRQSYGGVYREVFVGTFTGHVRRIAIEESSK